MTWKVMVANSDQSTVRYQPNAGGIATPSMGGGGGAGGITGGSECEPSTSVEVGSAASPDTV